MIEQVNFFNRTDGVDKSQNCYVLISNSTFTTSDLDSARAEASYEYYISGLVGSPTEIFPNVEGQYIRIQREDNGHLLIAELEAWGCVNPSPLVNYTAPNLLSFEATKMGQEAAIKWVMFKDNHVEKYEVEVSLTRNEEDFERLQTTEAEPRSKVHHYEIIDRKPTHGKNLYRLKVIQKDGAIYYSYPRLLNFDIDFEEVHIYPNPTNGIIYLTLRDFAGKKGTVEIYNSLGQKMISQNYNSFPTAPAVFDVSKMVSGVYSMVIKIDNHRRFAKKFVIQKK